MKQTRVTEPDGTPLKSKYISLSMSETIGTIRYRGTLYVPKEAHEQQVAALTTRCEALQAANESLKTMVNAFVREVAPMVEVQLAGQHPRQQRRAAEQLQHTGQTWVLQKITGLVLKDDRSLGDASVQIYRIVRNLSAGASQQQPQQDAASAAADTQPLFRPYDALQLASKHKLWQDDSVQASFKLVSHWEVAMCKISLTTFAASIKTNTAN